MHNFNTHKTTWEQSTRVIFSRFNHPIDWHRFNFLCEAVHEGRIIPGETTDDVEWSTPESREQEEFAMANTMEPPHDPANDFWTQMQPTSDQWAVTSIWTDRNQRLPPAPEQPDSLIIPFSDDEDFWE